MGDMRAADDALNEYLIEHAYRQLVKARDYDRQMMWNARLTEYVKRRSPERIAQMEREKGLR